jgi:hypothetical protein
MLELSQRHLGEENIAVYGAPDFFWLCELKVLRHLAIGAWLDRMSHRLAELMSSDPDWRDEAWTIVEMLDRWDIFVLPEGSTPRAWCRSLFETQALSGLARTMIDYGMEPEGFDRPLDIILNVLPSDHHLD